MTAQSELWDFLIYRLIHSDQKGMYEVLQFCSDMVMQDEEERTNRHEFYSIYFDSEDRSLLHEKMCRWFDANLLYTVYLIQKGIKNEEEEKNAIRNKISFRAKYLVRDIASGRVERPERSKEWRGQEGGQEKELAQGKEKEQEITYSSHLTLRDRAGVSVSGAPPDKQDMVFATDRQGPERQVLLKELFKDSGKLSLNDIFHSLTEKGDPGMSPSKLRAYLNTLAEADAGPISISVQSSQSMFNLS